MSDKSELDPRDFASRLLLRLLGVLPARPEEESATARYDRELDVPRFLARLILPAVILFSILLWCRSGVIGMP